MVCRAAAAETPVCDFYFAVRQKVFGALVKGEPPKLPDKKKSINEPESLSAIRSVFLLLFNTLRKRMQEGTRLPRVDASPPSQSVSAH